MLDKLVPVTALSWLRTALASLVWLLSFLSWLFPRQLKPLKSVLHPTSYLDALRGYAAWVVYHNHIIHGDWLPTSPWLLLFFRGGALVPLFYIISGFCISFSPLGRMHKQQSIQEPLASAVFRRYIRLYLPVVCASFVAMLVLATGLGSCSNCGDIVQPTFWGNLQFWLHDTVNFINPFSSLTMVWSPNVFGSRYLIQLWTIPIEFRSSLVVFLFLMGTAIMKPWVRSVSFAIGVFIACWWRTPHVSLFLFGALLADLRQWRTHGKPRVDTELSPPAFQDVELGSVKLLETPDLNRRKDSVVSTPSQSSSEEEVQEEIQEDVPEDSYQDEPLLPQAPTEAPIEAPTAAKSPSSLARRSLDFLREVPSFMLFGLAILCLTGPGEINLDSSFPYNCLSILVPSTWEGALRGYWLCYFAAMLLVSAFEYSSLLRKLLTNGFSQWLGELSFGIYIMHNTVRYVLWENHFIPWQIAYFGDDAGKFTSFLPGYIIMTIGVLWAAEGFRWVDGKCVLFTKMLAEKAFR